MSSYAEQEQDAREYAELKRQFREEEEIEPTMPQDGGFLLVDDEQVEEPIAFPSLHGAVIRASSLDHDYFTVYQLKKVL